MSQQAIAHAIDRLGVELVVDVGAHHGDWATDLRRHWAGDLVSVECAPAALEALRPRVAADPRWTLHEVALGDADGEAVLTTYPVGQLSSLHATTAFAEQEWNFGAGEQVTVPVRRLDGLLDLDRPTLLKVDTQGHDLAVLRGATGVWDAVVAVQLELSVAALYDGVPPFAEQVRRVQELGLDPVGFWPVSTRAAAARGADDLRVVEFDGLFVRRL